MKALLTILGLITCSISASADPQLATVIRVHDGDTITCNTTSGQTLTVRLNGIDAPELAQPYGANARAWLSHELLNKAVTLDVIGTDIYGRSLAKVEKDGVDENLAEIKAGLAWFYAKYQHSLSPADRISYAAAEADARTSRRGLWVDPEPQAPWSFRAAKRHH